MSSRWWRDSTRPWLILSMPVSLSHFYSGGSSLGVAYGLQVVTRLFLAMHYRINFKDLIVYTRDTEFGSMLRFYHATGASLFLFLLYWHLRRGLYYGSFNKNKLWGSRVVILLVSMGAAFLGYVLPYGQMSYWGATVIINLLSVFSYEICITLWRGFVVSEYTLVRMFSFHFLVPLVLRALLLIHVSLLHTSGGSSLNYSFNKIRFTGSYLNKDFFMWVVLMLGVGHFWLLFPNTLGDSDNYTEANPQVTPAHIKPEWYFLFAYAILRCVSNKTARVLLLFAAILILALAVVFSTRGEGMQHFTTVQVQFLLLTVAGGLQITLYNTFLSQVASVLYFHTLLFM